MTKFEIYSKLTTSEINNGTNLLESLKFYKNGLRLVTILSKIDSIDETFEVKYGFHGSLFEKQNSFTKTVILFDNINDKDSIIAILEKFKEFIDYDFKNKELTISLK